MGDLYQQKVESLHDLKILSDSTYENQKNHSSTFSSIDRVDVVFRGHKERLLGLISKFDWVAGCIAWLTDIDILNALAACKCVSLVVQKEDFLRPDTEKLPKWKERLRNAYEAVEASNRFLWPGLKGGLSVCYGDGNEAIRCVGNYNRDRASAFPRMHNKFLIFGNNEKFEGPRFTTTWTGSFNITYNATRSFENAVVVYNAEVAKAFYDEYAQIYAFSERLDWEHDWVAPEFRIGT